MPDADEMKKSFDELASEFQENIDERIRVLEQASNAIKQIEEMLLRAGITDFAPLLLPDGAEIWVSDRRLWLSIKGEDGIFFERRLIEHKAVVRVAYYKSLLLYFQTILESLKKTLHH